MSRQAISSSIGDIFFQCSNASNQADLRSISKVFWFVLDNSLSIVDLAGIFTLACSGQEKADSLDINAFAELLSGSGRIKYTSTNEFTEKLVDDIKNSKGLRAATDSPQFAKIYDRQVLKVLLKYDLPLKRVFSAYAGKNIRLGAGLSWNEVKQKGIGMELDGFVAFCGAFGIIPKLMTTQQCSQFIRDTLGKYPLLASASSLNSTILFPQFQLIMCILALSKYEATVKAPAPQVAEKNGFAKKVNNADAKAPSEIIRDFLMDIGIDKNSKTTANPSESVITNGIANLMTLDSNSNTNRQNLANTNNTSMLNDSQALGSAISTGITMPSSDKPEDPYISNLEHSRQAMLLRVDHLLDEVDRISRDYLIRFYGDNYARSYISNINDYNDAIDMKSKLISKPVVICDAIPVPQYCPDIVEQLLQAALAHHNLGNGEESLKFLEAARLHSEERHRKKMAEMKAKELQQQSGNNNNNNNNNDFQDDNNHDDDQRPKIDESRLLRELTLYILMCKGNVYQTCGDDEQSIVHYLQGLKVASDSKVDLDWEMLFINALGLLAYYNVRFQVAALCFNVVLHHRIKNSGEDSADSATTYNNEGCAYYCMNMKGDARNRFEKAWSALCNSIGHRAPRAITVWKNLEKARRSNAAHRTVTDLNETISRRDDADHILVGGTFVIKALAPPEEGGKKKKGKKGGKKKKK